MNTVQIKNFGPVMNAELERYSINKATKAGLIFQKKVNIMITGQKTRYTIL